MITCIFRLDFDGCFSRFLWDRSIIDPLIYTKVFCKNGAVDDMLMVTGMQAALLRYAGYICLMCLQVYSNSINIKFLKTKYDISNPASIKIIDVKVICIMDPL